jgi:linoleate 8R-lipoxygenase/9,12-octadecadienoate 8-hydroperoxide 8R-isomerase
VVVSLLLIMAESDASAPNAPATLRQEIDQVFSSIRGLIKASARPLPTQTGDGSYVTPPITTGLIKDLQHMEVSDVEPLMELVKKSVLGKPTDDKTYFMEKLIELTSKLPLSSKTGVQLTNGLVNQLWSDLQHPPQSYLGDQHMYRQADGSCNVDFLLDLSRRVVAKSYVESNATSDGSSR